MNTKVNITPDMIKLSKVILKNMEQLSRMVKQQDKNLGTVTATCTAGGHYLNVAIFDADLVLGYITQDIDIEGNVTVNVQDFSKENDDEN
jgi:hypothetical protein